MKIWQKTSFWEAIKRTFATFSGPAVVGVNEFGAADKWVILAGIFAMLGGIISIWCSDNNNNGEVDLFE